MKDRYGKKHGCWFLTWFLTLVFNIGCSFLTHLTLNKYMVQFSSCYLTAVGVFRHHDSSPFGSCGKGTGPVRKGLCL